MDLYGNFIPGFCGGISLGDWHDLPALQRRAAEGCLPQIAQLLMDSGSYGLYQFAVDQYGYTADAEGYVGACHLCVDVRRHLALTGDFRELTPLPFYEGLDGD
jgi:hypothetical protein